MMLMEMQAEAEKARWENRLSTGSHFLHRHHDGGKEAQTHKDAVCVIP